MDYTTLLIEADNNNLITKDKPLRANDGRIKGNRIAIRADLNTTEKKCVLAEELGHFYTSTDDIMDQSTVENRKQEQKAREWAFNKLIGLYGLLDAYKAGCQNIHEVAEYLDITEEFLSEALTCYRRKYGDCVSVDNYVIYFEPNLGVLDLKRSI